MVVNFKTEVKDERKGDMWRKREREKERKKERTCVHLISVKCFSFASLLRGMKSIFWKPEICKSLVKSKSAFCTMNKKANTGGVLS